VFHGSCGSAESGGDLYEYASKCSGSVKREAFLEQLSDYQIFEEENAEPLLFVFLAPE
jgi:hypothetical protein